MGMPLSKLSSPTFPPVIPDIFNRESSVFVFSVKRKALGPRVRKDDKKWLFSYQSLMQAGRLHTKG